MDFIKNSKIVFVDLDGTLLDSEKTLVSKRNAEFIKRINKDKEIVLSTSRGYDYKVYELVERFNLNYVILYNGAKIYKKHHLVATNYLPIDEMNKITNYLIKKRKNFVVFDEENNNIYVYNIFQQFVGSFVRGINPINFNNLALNKTTFKISLIMKTPFFTNRWVKKLRKMFPILNISSSSANYVVEITVKKCTKGDAALQVCKLLNIDSQDSIHIGDSMTDATCLNKVGNVVALSNASRSFKKIANHIGPHYKNGGLYKLFYE